MKFYQKWEGRNCSREENEWFSVRVPGNIQKDYADFKKFGDLQFSDNHKKLIPFENDSWEYRTHVEYKKDPDEKVYFVSRGINYKYDIALNGEKLYSYEGMFRAAEIDLTEKLTDGDNVLTVYIYPHPKRAGAKAGTRDEADDSCNPPVYYGWDWNPRLLISGIWDGTYIETRGKSYISDCEVISRLDSDMKRGTVICNFDCSEECEIALFDAEGAEIYKGKDKIFTVDSPNLWWCNGQGNPYLYSWVISNGKEERRGHIGFKRLRLVRNEGATGPSVFPKGRYEAPITIELNGRRIFAKGSNWVNPELFWGDITKERYEELIMSAKVCNMNIFRMWGGAGAPKETFYDICDREGILIWQEFMLACNNYVGTPNYMRVLESEAGAIIKKFRSHPSLAFWCGGNELFNSWSGMDEQSMPLRLLNKLCFELDGERPFLYTSPLYGMAHGGYTFFAEDQGGDVFAQFSNAYNTAYTEFGVPAIADIETLREIIPENELFPVKATPAWFAHHAFGAWGHSRWLCADVLERYFGKAESLEDMIKQSEWLQCEGYRAAFEESRRQWPHCSMAINWCYNEPWKTAAGNNLITYPAKPRASYYYVKNALRPTLFSAKVAKFDWKEGETFEAELWLLNDTDTHVAQTVKVIVQVGDKREELLEWRAETAPRANKRGPTVRFLLPCASTDRIVLILSSDDGMESTYEFLYKPKRAANTTHRQMNI